MNTADFKEVQIMQTNADPANRWTRGKIGPSTGRRKGGYEAFHYAGPNSCPFVLGEFFTCPDGAVVFKASVWTETLGD